MPLPDLMMVTSVLPVLDIAGIAIFAISGALAAARRRLTVVTFFVTIVGLLGMLVPEELGGAGLDALGMALAVAALASTDPERLARHCRRAFWVLIVPALAVLAPRVRDSRDSQPSSEITSDSRLSLAAVLSHSSLLRE